MTEVGFIGLGNMGGALARRLSDAGHRLVVCDREPDRMQAFIMRGAVSASSPKAVADRTETIISCLPSCEASLEVARQISTGTQVRTYVETSTIGRDTILAIDEICAPKRIVLIDAPVSGGPRGAEAGTLAMMVAAAPDSVARIRPLLDAMAGRLFVVGVAPGLAQICKVVNNAISLSTLVLSCEAIVLGVKAGVDARVLVDVINASSGRNSATSEKIPKSVLTRSFDFGGPLGAGIKDLDLYMQEARSLGLPSHSVANFVQLWAYANGHLDQKADFTTIVKCFEEWAGVEVKG